MRYRIIAILLALAAIILLAISLGVGPAGISLGQLFSGLNGNESTIIYQLRLPRALLAALAGASLGVSGTLMQTTFGNPLAEPYITGISAGGALGAVAAASLGIAGVLPTALFAIAGGFLVTLALYLFAATHRNISTMSILLMGIAIGTFCGALVWFLLLRLGPGGTDQALAWLLGRVTTEGYSEVIFLLAFLALGGVLAWRSRHALDALLMGEEKAVSLGVDLRASRYSILGAATILAAACVAFCGVIAFVGLIVPHITRSFTGSIHSRLLPAAALGGAVMLLAVDIVSRTIDPPREIPLTIITSLVGAPFFIFILVKMKVAQV